MDSPTSPSKSTFPLVCKSHKGIGISNTAGLRVFGWALTIQELNKKADELHISCNTDEATRARAAIKHIERDWPVPLSISFGMAPRPSVQGAAAGGKTITTPVTILMLATNVSEEGLERSLEIALQEKCMKILETREEPRWY